MLAKRRTIEIGNSTKPPKKRTRNKTAATLLSKKNVFLFIAAKKHNKLREREKSFVSFERISALSSIAYVRGWLVRKQIVK